MLRLLLANRIRATVAALRGAGWAQLAVVCAFIALGAAMITMAYLGFLRGFGFLIAEDQVGPLVARYVLETSFSIVFFLGVASFVASSTSFFYRAEELNILATLPIPPVKLFFYRFLMAAISAAWPVALISVPAMAAYAVVMGGGFAQVLFVALIIGLFTAAISLVGALLSFVLAPFARKLPSPALWIAEAVVFFGVAAIMAKQIVPRSIMVTFAGAVDAPGVAIAERRVSEMFALMPSSPFVRAIIQSLTENGVAPYLLLKILFTLVILSVVLMMIARRSYLSLWQSYGSRPMPVLKKESAQRKTFPRIFKLGYGFLLEKDLLMLTRDGGEMARAASLGALLVLFVATLRAVADIGQLGSPQLFTFAVTFAFASVGYLALTFCMRFVFPAFSLEGRGAWAVLSSPIHAHELYSWKFFFWVAVLELLTVPAIFVAAVLFSLPSALTFLLMMAMACVAATVVAMTLGQGTLFPRFRERNPDLIATTPAGLSATAIGIAYLLIIVRYVHVAMSSYLALGVVPARDIFGIIIVSFALAGTYWTVVTRSLDRIEIVS